VNFRLFLLFSFGCILSCALQAKVYPGLKSLKKIRVLISNPKGQGHMSSSFSLVRRLMEEGFCGEFELVTYKYQQESLDYFFSEKSIALITEKTKALYRCEASFRRVEASLRLDEVFYRDKLQKFMSTLDPVDLTITGGIDRFVRTNNYNSLFKTRYFLRLSPYGWGSGFLAVPMAEAPILAADSSSEYSPLKADPDYNDQSYAGISFPRINDGLWLPRFPIDKSAMELSQYFEKIELARLFERRDEFMIFPQYGLGTPVEDFNKKRKLMALVFKAMVALEQEKPILFLNFDPIDSHRFFNEMDPSSKEKFVEVVDVRDLLSALDRGRLAGKIVFLNMPRVPHFLFEAIFREADIAPLVQGANTMNLMRRGSKAYWALAQNRDDILAGFADNELEKPPFLEPIKRGVRQFLMGGMDGSTLDREVFPSFVKFLQQSLDPESQVTRAFQEQQHAVDHAKGDKVGHWLNFFDSSLEMLSFECEKYF